MTRLAPGRWAAVVLFAAAAATPLVVRDVFILDSVILILLYGSLAAAWNVAGGYAGQVSLGHAAFFGIGAYAAALMSARYQQSPWLGLAVGVGLSIAAGGLIGFLSNRLRGPYFALSTIAFAEVLKIVASRWRTVVGVILPTSLGGILTGTTLAVARVAGETAPLLFTSALTAQAVTWDPRQPLQSLPLSIFQLSDSTDPADHARAWAAGIVLMGFVLVTSLAARAFLARSRRNLSK